MNNKKSTLNKLILFILSYSLLFNNVVYASSIVTLFNKDIEEELEDKTAIDNRLLTKEVRE